MTKTIEERDHVVVRFAGDSGDGMQLTGDRFTSATAVLGNDLATLPDFPAEIRAPPGRSTGSRRSRSSSRRETSRRPATTPTCWSR
jgi:2-oxoglutarate ferredoxin oxidoreductase subunit alpha